MECAQDSRRGILPDPVDEQPVQLLLAGGGMQTILVCKWFFLGFFHGHFSVWHLL